MARKYRRKKYRRRGLMSKVKKAIKKEVNKGRELKKLVSFVADRPLRSINTEFIGSANTPFENTIIYSLTGGRVRTFIPTDHPQDPDVDTNKSLFAMRPMFANAQSVKVSAAGEGGIVDDNANTGDASLATQGVHQLQGRECYLKNWYCNLRVNNQGHQSFTTPAGNVIAAQDPQAPIATYVRLLVVETRRPLGGMRTGGGYNSLARQLFLQYHAGDGTQTQAPPATDINADSVTGFLNLQVIKKVMFDKMVWLSDGDKGGYKTQFLARLKLRLNRKARWNYNYDTADSDPTEGHVSYEGPWIYMIMINSNQTSQDTQVCPRVNLSSILTFYDD